MRFRFDLAPMTGEIEYDMSDSASYGKALDLLAAMRVTLRVAGVTITKETAKPVAVKK